MCASYWRRLYISRNSFKPSEIHSPPSQVREMTCWRVCQSAGGGDPPFLDFCLSSRFVERDFGPPSVGAIPGASCTVVFFRYYQPRTGFLCTLQVTPLSEVNPLIFYAKHPLFQARQLIRIEFRDIKTVRTSPPAFFLTSPTSDQPSFFLIRYCFFFR